MTNENLFIKMKHYWEGKLTADSVQSSFPADTAVIRGEVKGQAEYQFELSEELAQKIIKMSSGSEQRLIIILASAIIGLVTRYNQNDDYLLFLPINRQKEKGNFINTLLPLCDTISVQQSFKDLILQVWRNYTEAIENQNYPVKRLLQKFYSTDSDEQRLTLGVAVLLKNIQEEEFISQFNFQSAFLFEKADERILGTLRYNPSEYRKETIVGIVDHFVALLQNAVENTDTKLASVEILSKSELNRLLVDFNHTAGAYQEDQTIHQLFEAQVKHTPEKIALVFGDRKITYQELNLQANRLARFIRSKGVRPKDIVGIMIERSPEMIVAILAILKAGGAYLPIDPQYPSDRIKYIIEDSKTKIILTNQKYQSLEFFQQEIIDISNESPITDESVVDLVNVSSPDDIGYVIYTSGSTGRPKGTLVQHRGISNLKSYFENQLGVTKEDHVVQFASSSFDASVWEIFMALLNGATLHLLKRETINQTNAFEKYLNEKGITIVTLPPTYLSTLNPDNVHTLRLLVTAGSATNFELVSKWNKKCTYINGYGPTETTICATTFDCTGLVPGYAQVPIGKPILNAQVYIVDRNLRILPIGVAGELCIGGPMVGQGYLNQNDLTREKFVDCPFAHGTKMYRTGDLARWLPDGNIEFLGRIDHQVKIRGYRIELGEIENQLLQYDFISETLVVEREEDQSVSGEKAKFLCAYYTVKAGAEGLTNVQLRDSLIKVLPEYMIPAFLIQIDNFPLTPNGKVDRKALPDPHLSVEEEYLAPRNELENKLAEFWSELLRIEHIGLKSNFFRNGGDSIKAIQFISRLKKHGYTLDIKDLFTYPTIEHLVKYVRTINTVTTSQEPVIGEVKLTPIQQWFFKSSFTSPHHFNQHVMVVCKDGLQETIVKTVFEKLIEDHDALRMTFEYKTNQDNTRSVVQYNHGLDREFLSFQVFDLLKEQDLESKIETEANRIQESIDLERGPLLKLALFKTRHGDQLLIVAHHLIIDGISWRILLEDFASGYRQVLQGEPLCLEAKSTSYQEWAENLSKYAESSKLQKEKAYWNETVAAISTLPKDNTVNDGRYRDRASVTIEFDGIQTSKLLREVNQAYNTEINDILLAALGLAIKEWAHVDNLCVNLEGHGREQITYDADISRTIGWFTSQFPFVMEIKAIEELSQFIKQTKEKIRQIPNRGFGYGVLKFLAKDSEIGMNGLKPDISFNYLGQLDEIDGGWLQLSNISGGSDISSDMEMISPISVDGMIKQGRLSFTFTYHNAEYRKESIAEFAAAYKNNLINVINHCAGKIITDYTPSDYGLSIELESIEIIRSMIRETCGENVAVESMYSLSPMQEGMLFHYMYHKKSSAYFMQELFDISGNLDIQVFNSALDELSNRYHILRTCFIFENIEEPVQVVLKERKNHAYYHDFSGIADEETKAREISRVVAEDREKGFDLFKDSLLRVSVLKVTAESYKILWSFHHILMDGWCTSIIFSDLFNFYEAHLKGTQPELKEIVPFEKHIRWLKKQDKDASLSFWKKYLSGYEQQVSLPKTGVKLKNSEFQNEKSKLVLDEATVQKLKAVAVDSNVTMNVLFQTIWGIILQKYNDVDDVVFGAVVSGRPPDLVGVEDMVGLFINTVPVRIGNTDSGFYGLLRQVQQESTEMKAHEYCPLSEVQLQSTLNNELLDHILVFENYPLDLALEELNLLDRLDFTIGHSELDEQTNYDLTVVILPDRQYTIEFRYNGLVYEPILIERLKQHLLKVIQTVTEKPEIAVSKINILTDTEENELLYCFDNTDIVYPQEKTIHQLFEEQTFRMPDRIAVSDGNQELTYKELNQKADNLAALIMKKGIKAGDIVAIMTEKSLGMIVATLAVLKAGGAYLPIDPDFPKARIEYMLEDSGTRMLLTRDSILAKLELSNLNQQIETIDIEAEMDSSTWQRGLQSPAACCKPSDLAYIIYTSGTTGKPKGAMIEHRNVVRLLFNNKFQFDFSEKDVWTMFHSHCFDFSVWEMYGALLYGGRLVMIPKAVARDTERFADILECERVTVLNQTPSAFYNLIQVVLREKQKDLALRYVIFGGEALKPTQLKSWYQHYPNTKLINMYGITETTVHVTYKEIGAEEIENNISNIGKPLPDLTTYVMNRELKLLPAGCAGELCVGGAGVGRGYLNRPELTEQKFVSNPYKQEERLYRSGDLVRQLENGELEYLGRIDHQVKIRGFRIELNEIEHAILQSKAIREAVVIARTESGQNPFLAAYYLSEREIPYSEFKKYLSIHLPDYMIPAYFIKLEKIPLTANGKVDRAALPKPRISTELNSIAPRNEREEIMVKVWQEVLGIEKIGIRTNFFEIGGDSIKSIQMSSRLKKAGYRMEIKDLFSHPTIEQLSSLLKENTLLHADQGPVTGRVALTPIQSWFFELKLQEQHHFNQQIMLFSADGFDIAIIKKVFEKLITHHDALRMRYKIGEEIVQYNQGPETENFAFQTFDLRNSEQVSETISKCCEEIQASLNLTQGPLVSLGLFQTSEGDHLLIVIHHLVVDGVSWRILFEDLDYGYKQVLRGTEIRFPEKTTSFKEWSERLNQYTRESSALAKEKAYWESVEQSIRPIPRNKSITVRKIKDQQTAQFSLDDIATNRLLRDVNRAYNTNINDLLLTALGLSCKEWFGMDQFVVNLEGHGRETLFENADVSRTVGWFTNQYPVALKLNGFDDIGLELKYIKESLRRIPNKGIGYGLLKYLAGTQLDNKHTNSLEISFNYLGQIDEDINEMGFSLSHMTGGSPASPEQETAYLLDINAIVQNQQLMFYIAYNPYDYTIEEIDRFIDSLRCNLNKLIDHCAAKELPESTPHDYGIDIGLESFERLRSTIQELSDGARTIEDIYFLSPMQEGMLFHHMYNQASAAYIEQFVFDLRGTPEITIVEACLRLLSQKYGILRTCFVYENVEKPVQVVLNQREIPLYYEDISMLVPGKMDEQLQDFILEDRRRGFDLFNDSLLRVSVLKTGPNNYKLIWNFHHIIMDGWCTSLIYSDFFTFYESIQKGFIPEVNETTPYASYIRWLAKQDKEKALSFWTNYLEGYEQLTALPKRLTKAGETEYSLKKERITLGADLTQRIESLSAQYKITHNVIFQTLWGILLQKYNNTDDVVFGAVVSGRPPELEGIETCAGLFINTIPVRIRNCGQQFGGLLQQVQTEAIKAKEFEYSLLSEVQACSELKNQLFDHILVFENYPVDEKLKELDLEERLGFTVDYSAAHDETNYDFFITVLPSDSVWNIEFSYNSLAIDSEVIQKLMGHFLKITETLLDNPDMDINSLSILTKSEVQELFTDCDYLRVKYPHDKTLVEIFEEQVEKTPNHTAVVFQDDFLTYRELNNKANCLASILRSSGVSNDSIVGLVLDRSLELVVSIIAILKAGGAYLPVDPDYPQDRIQFILSDSKTGVVVTTKDAESLIPDGLMRILADDESLYHSAEPNPQRINKSSDLAYIIYTSGTTGLPKGVMVEHRNVSSLFFHNLFQFDFSETDVWTMFHSHCFDFSVWEMYGALLFGGRVIVVPKMVAKDPSAYLEILIKHQVTILNQTPSAFYNLIDESLKSPEQNLKLRYVIFGGEALMPKKLELWHKKYPEVALINMFGITETTVHVTYKRITLNEIENNISNIGRPIPNLYTYILDKDLNPVPVGVAGELYVGGEGVSRGYLNREELTSERFISNPFKPNSRLYRSGDLARLLPNKDMEYLGRIDHQVQLRGFRIELGEIESCIMKMEAVNDVIVIARKDDAGNYYLAAYYTSDKNIDEAELRGSLSQSVPDYMIPAYFVNLEAMPLTSNGKVDRRALPEPKIKSLKYQAPRNDIEAKLAEIWSLNLEMENASINDNYFALGGDSIKAIRLVNAIKLELGGNISIRDLYINPTIAMLSGVLTTEGSIPHQQEEYHEILDELARAKTDMLQNNNLKEPENIEDIYPMSDIEKGMFFYTVTDPSLGIYHDQMLYIVEAYQFHSELFKHAMLLLMEKHPILRTGFFMPELGEPVQIVYKTVSPEIVHKDISKLSVQEQEDLIQEAMANDRERPFGWNDAPLWRMNTFILDDSRACLFFTCHHAIIDGWSDASLMTELNNVYLKLKEDRNYIPEKLVSTYKDYVIQELMEKRHEPTRSFWLKELEDYKKIPLPETNAQNDLQEQKRLELVLENELSNSLADIGKRYNISIKHIYFAAFVYTLNMLTYDNDVTVGLVTNNRPTCTDGDKILGCFLNTIPVRTVIPNSITWEGFLKFIDEKLITLKSYDRLSLFEIMKLMDEKSNDVNPFFDVIFNYVDFHIFDQLKFDPENNNESEYGGVSQSKSKDELDVDGKVSTNTFFDLTIDHSNGAFTVTVDYTPNIFEKEKVEELIGYFTAVLTNFIYHPQDIASKGVLLTPAMKQKVLFGLNNTESEFSSYKTVIEWFERQEALTPDRKAVQLGDSDIGSLTYQELNRKANQLAGLLRDNGIKPDKVVGILMDKSVEMVAAVLGVLKSGGAYLPLDPVYPADRLQYMAAASGAALIITKSRFQAALGVDAEILDIEDIRWDDYSPENISPIGKPSDLAYVIFTSGTTGQPKGVMVENKNFVNIAQAWRDCYELERFTPNLLQMASFSFDVFSGDLARCLLNGGTLVLCPESIRLDFEKLYQLIRNQRISLIESTPALMIPFLKYVDENKLPLDSLKLMIIGSDVCRMEDFKDMMARFGKRMRVLNSYGVTEATIDSSFYEADLENLCTTGNVPIGKPMPNVKFYILDHGLDLQPLGVPGELYIGGAGVARGYLNQCCPEEADRLNETRFLPDPFDPGARMYKTGDMAKWLPDGNMAFLGRGDNQVKVRGYRIETGEIEDRLLKHNLVSEAVVAVQKDTADNNYLCAYYVLKKDERSSAISETDLMQSLRVYLSEFLPEYMLPSFYIPMEQFPLTPNGKIDRKRLPLPEYSTAEEEEFEPPEDETEEALLNIFREVLGNKSLNTNSNFFMSGGDSIKVIQVASRLRKLGIKLEIKDLFQNPTIKAVKPFISMQNIIHAEQGIVTGPVPLTPVQTAFFSSQTHHRNHYNQSVMLFSSEGFDITAITKVLEKLTEHHDALRMVYTFNNETVLQYNRDAEGSCFDLQVFNLQTNDYEFIAQKANEIQSGIDLEQGPLVKVGLFKTEQGDHLLIVIHHMVIDGVSWRILFEDLAAGYKQVLNGEPIVFQEKTTSFKDWSEALHNYARTSADLSREVPYWARINERLVKPIPKDNTITKRLNRQCGTVIIKLTPEATFSLMKEINYVYNTEINDILLTALGLTISEWTGEDLVLVNLESHGREVPVSGVDISRTVGWFTAEYPLLLDISKSSDLAYNIKSVKECLRSIPQKGFGYGVLRYLVEDKSPVLSNLPEISFNYLGQFDQDTDELFTTSEISSGKDFGDEYENQYALDINGMIEEGTLQFVFMYDNTEYRYETVLSLADNYRLKLLEIIDHCKNKDEQEFTPSDYGASDLSLNELESIENIIDNLEIEI